MVHQPVKREIISRIHYYPGISKTDFKYPKHASDGWTTCPITLDDTTGNSASSSIIIKTITFDDDNSSFNNVNLKFGIKYVIKNNTTFGYVDLGTVQLGDKFTLGDQQGLNHTFFLNKEYNLFSTLGTLIRNMRCFYLGVRQSPGGSDISGSESVISYGIFDVV